MKSEGQTFELIYQGHDGQKKTADQLMMDYDMDDDTSNPVNLIERDIFVDDNDEVHRAGTTTDKDR